MTESAEAGPCRTRRSRLIRLVIVLAGIVLGQAALYGPSLAGRKILLPLDILAAPSHYVPVNLESPPPPPHNLQFVDLVFLAEPSRLYLGSELRAGRFPLWNPYQFAGVPDILPKFSPFVLLGALVASPKVLPWIELLKAMVGGLGAYLFCRRALQVGFWPASIAGWCYPLTAFFVLWQEYPTSVPVLWFPWLLLAVDRTARGASFSAPIALSLTTWLALASGQLDVAGQALLASGFYALWCLAEGWSRSVQLGIRNPKSETRNQFEPEETPGTATDAGEVLSTETQFSSARGGRLLRAAVALTAAWSLGFLLASPYVLPLLDYAHTGARVERRRAGIGEERPPVGLAALPQVVLPKMYGTTEPGSVPNFPPGQGNLAESSAAAYVGLLATLFAAPLAWCSRRHRSINLFWVLLAFFALSWCLDVPPLVALLRLPVLNMMSHDRFVFAAAFAILALAATGLNALWGGQVSWRWWFWLPITALAGLGAWCAMRALILPEAVESYLPEAVMNGRILGWIHDMQGVQQAQAWYIRMFATEALLCGLALAAWAGLWFGTARLSWFRSLVGLFLLAELVWFGVGRAAQCDPALYYPRIPALDQIANSAPGRIIGYGCLPALLGMTEGLHDIRGYDGVDPARFLDLLMLAAHPESKKYPYALAQLLSPQALSSTAEDLRLPPVLDMLGVRYLVLRGSPPPEARPAFRSPDYWVMINYRALARAFVPHHVETVFEDEARLQRLSSPQFDPREVAYVECATRLSGLCLGNAEIVSETPTRVTLTVRMQTAGLVVLADRWDKDWRAYLDGRAAPILRANHAIRGVAVPEGDGTLEFRYEPSSFYLGLKLAGMAVVLLLGWAGHSLWKDRAKLSSRPTLPQNPPTP